MLNVAIVGLGYWGPNLARTFSTIPDVRVVSLCDRDIERARSIGARHCPDAEIISDIDKVAKIREELNV